jgi:uncharacterized membrane protein YfcA
MLLDFSLAQVVVTAVIFVWTGFVRSALGFGGAALGLPVLLFIHDKAVDWLPIIGLHLLFFSVLTLRSRLNSVDWSYLRRSGVFVVPAALAGVLGLLNLPNQWLLMFIYGFTLFYAMTWAMNWVIQSNNSGLDKTLLVLGGYVAGTSLTGAPLMVAVFMRHVAAAKLRNTLFVLWFILVSMKLGTFMALGVSLHATSALLLLPIAAIGHVVGLRAHDRILENDRQFKKVVGSVLVLISAMGLWHVIMGGV